MKSKILWDNMFPQEVHTFMEAIRSSSEFALTGRGHIDVRGRQYMAGFPIRKGHYVNVGYVGMYERRLIVVAVNTEIKYFEKLHKDLAALVEEVKSRFDRHRLIR